MRTLVDSSSLVALARYYRPFDTTNVIDDYLRANIASGSIIVLDKVFDEIKYLSNGLAVTAFPCLTNKHIVVSTKDLMPNRKFFNMLDNNFVDNAVKRRRFNDDIEGYNNEKENYLKGADCALIVYAINNSTELDPIQILTEESRTQNDNKLFRKIPFICHQINIKTITTADFLKEDPSIDVNVLKI